MTKEAYNVQGLRICEGAQIVNNGKLKIMGAHADSDEATNYWKDALGRTNAALYGTTRLVI